ncbi:hypothetical protein GP486_005696 [Trichoglossum hirsutum]|uniref:Epoxide hydrolase N-terminal domain-containing protein n=1 Tax=Trichoglossum hirsutum TaxID=265104 RepID=A0A9P8L8S1_9PEZI|nr:hypothetical protein GP486_005696 [Trichoglossum hirsutum]
MAEPTPFNIHVADDLLKWIRQRVSTARIPPLVDLPADKKWSYGTPPDVVQHLAHYWATAYDWRAVEARLNSTFRQFTIPISESGEDLTIHFVHHKSPHPNAIPLLFQHGWPGSFLEVGKIIDSLTNPEKPTQQQAYHVVAPSLPGFTFSSSPKKPGFGVRKMAAVNHKLMLALGYKKYMVQGGDWGSMVVRLMALDYPEACKACHLNMMVALPPSALRNPRELAYLALSWLTPTDKAMLGRLQWFMKHETGYSELQATKSQTLNYALMDSPVGILAWIREKLEAASEDDYVWEDEDVITWVMLYLANGTSGHSEIFRDSKYGTLKADLLERIIPPEVVVGGSWFPKEVYFIPRWWARCRVATNIVYWKEHNKGGHFAAWERPTELVEDVREFTEKVPEESLEALRKAGSV